MDKNLDAIDLRILKELSRDGRLSNNQLAERVGLSTSPCWQRVKRLEKEGYIEGYIALLNSEKLGITELVIIEVTLERHDEKILEEFGRAMINIPEVLEVYLTTGEYDYQIKVAVKGTKGYEEFLREKLYKIPGIRHSRSSFTLRCLKKSHSITPTA
ncbi:Lrp/AsnC family transcriptional regulator [Terasakiella pusilla]|jgi:Lrp/AsnC family leucine-responsive transcriptional regulator|uniref:Lrp/AsnC family transcriptional regulator n=1 Tax=Terasakiella pusilla TaxID=64973 RepID=UPI00048C1710|nr:Lrp/AsnC family transcriptional regulator [Terasakiella pusilla]